MIIGRKRKKEIRIPFWNGVSIFEKIALIVCPFSATLMLYLLFESAGFDEWIRILMSIGSMVILSILIYFFADFMSRREWD